MYGFSTNGYQARDVFAAPFAPADGAGGALGQTISPGQSFGVARTPDAVVRSLQYNGGAPSGAGSLSGTPDMSSIFGTFLGFVQQMFGLLSQMMQGGGSAQPGQTAPAPPAAPWQNGSAPSQQFFANADGGSIGDPHDSFNGTSNGTRTDTHWDDMRSHQNLLSSDSFRGGYRVSTQVTAGANGGATMNSAATVSTDRGNSTVTVNADGSYSISASGNQLTLAAGQTGDLGNGASVTHNADGSFTVNAQNGNGGLITTTLTPRNGGVDVTNHAQNVNLGGYLVNRTDDPARPPLMRYTQNAPMIQP
jgi:hypothetical protein